MERKLKKKWKFIIASVAILIVLSASVVLIFFEQFSNSNPAHKNYIQYKDNISGLSLVDSGGQDYTLDTEYSKLLVYLSSDCGTCIDALPILDEINQIFCVNQGVEMLLLWENKIPKDRVKQNNLLSNSYSLGNVSISSSLDTVFWVDKSNEVRFVDSNGYENVLLFLLDEGVVDQETAVTNANDYIISKYISDQTYPNLVYFSMPGCPDCEEASQIISSSLIGRTFNITRIERDKNANDGDIVDKLGIYKMVYGIDWYPSFLVLQENGDFSFVGKTDADELEQTLLKDANYAQG